MAESATTPDTDDRRHSAPRAGRFAMTIPADWSILPLDPRNRDRRIAGLVEQRVGKADQFAYTRRQCIIRLRKAAAEAWGRGAFFAAMHNGVVKGSPLAASALALMGPPVTDSGGAILSDPQALAAHLARSERTSDGGETDKGRVLEHSVVTLQVGQAARIRQRSGTDLEALDGTAVLAGGVHFYVPLPEAGKTLVLMFSTPLLSLAGSYAHLFDTMAASARWIARQAHE